MSEPNPPNRDLLTMLGCSFEEFAFDHEKHRHCHECKGCLLDIRPAVWSAFPLWCVGCRERIRASTPYGKKLPWEVEYV